MKSSKLIWIAIYSIFFGIIIYFGLSLITSNNKITFRKYTTEWKVQVKYVDNTSDTFKFISDCYPEINIRNGVSILHVCWGIL